MIGIPLRKKDDDAPLDLQALIEQCYRNGSYDDDIDYNRDPDPPLEGADARWADELLGEPPVAAAYDGPAAASVDRLRPGFRGPPCRARRSGGSRGPA